MLINTYSRELRESAEDVEQQSDAGQGSEEQPRTRHADDANALSADQVEEVMQPADASSCPRPTEMAVHFLTAPFPCHAGASEDR